MTKLTIKVDTDFSTKTLSNVTDIIFTGNATAIFAASQFNGIQIASDVNIIGMPLRLDSVVVRGGSVDASGWTFSQWTDDHFVSLQGGAANDTIIGSSEAELVLGGDGDDDLSGGLGGDTLEGGDGNDTLTGGEGDDYLYGDAGKNVLFGGDGNDKLIAEFRGFRLLGGSGDDILESSAGNSDLSGGGGNDSITCRDVGDQVNGGDGGDVLTLRYDFDTAGVTVNIAGGGGGLDIGNGTTISNVEYLSFTGGSGNDSASGGEFNDGLTGGDGDDLLVGNAGDDGLSGGRGKDVMSGGIGNDILNDGTFSPKGDGRDLFFGGIGNDTINATTGNNRISGGGGDDQITAGSGLDKMVGGDGNDVFTFVRLSSSLPGDKQDIIVDFEPGKDRIDLSSIDATDGGSFDSFHFIWSLPFSGEAGELRFRTFARSSILEADTDGDKIADFAIAFDTSVTFHRPDFLL